MTFEKKSPIFFWILKAARLSGDCLLKSVDPANPVSHVSRKKGISNVRECEALIIVVDDFLGQNVKDVSSL